VRSHSLALAPRPSLGDVPVPLTDLPGRLAQHESPKLRGRGHDQESAFELDLALLRLAPFIDGARTVQEVISASRLQDEHVVLCLRHLQHFGYIDVIPPIHRQSRYLLTPEFHVAFDQPETVQEVVRYVTAGRHSDVHLVEIVQSLYAAVDGLQQTIEEFKERHEEELREHDISLRHFVTFGLLQGFLEVIDDYNQDLSEGEQMELQELRPNIRRLKEELKEKGMDAAQVNKEPQVKTMVARLNELKAKEKANEIVDPLDLP